MRLTVEQCRAARALLDWTAADLAHAGDLGVMTVKRFEGGQAIAASSVDKIVGALRNAGVVLISDLEHSTGGGRGVRLENPGP
jgi:DNA-binding IscR family transcriptional regulator